MNYCDDCDDVPWEWWNQTIQLHEVHTGWRLRVKQSHNNGRTDGNDYIIAKYYSAGCYMNKDIDIYVHYAFPDNTGYTNTDTDADASQNAAGHTQLGIMGTATEDDCNVRMMNFTKGFTFYGTKGVTVTYSFYWAGTNTKIPITNCAFTWGSLNVGEGVKPLDCDSVDYYKQAGAVPVVSSNGYLWNDGSDPNATNWVDEFESSTFWMSMGTTDVYSSSYEFTFNCLGSAIWNCPSLGWIGCSAEIPYKQIVEDDGSYVTETTRNEYDDLIYEVVQPVETLGYFGTGMLKYSSFIIKDELPSKVDFAWAQLLKRKNGSSTCLASIYIENNAQTTNDVGTFRYSGRTISFTFNSTYLTNTMEYVGESYVVVIGTTVKGTTNYTAFTNTGTTEICGNEMTTNEVIVNYGIWWVRYDPNGSSNPSHQTGEKTQNTVTSVSGMPDSQYQHGVTGKLRKNDFIRTGYTFTGWNTKADGSGTSYMDEYANVLDWASSNGIVTLYAQWVKKLGTETIQIVSEETGDGVGGVTLRLRKDVNGTWTTITTQTTGSDGTLALSDLHWFDYEWVMTGVPAGYVVSPNTAFSISYDNLTVENTVILYMKHVNITVKSIVDCIIDGEDSPAFVYDVDGTDAAGIPHSYHMLVQTASTKTGSTTLSGIFAGKYTITQTPVSRYTAQTAVNVSHATVNGTSATVDVLNYTSASVNFPYLLTNHGWFYGVESTVNSLTK